MEDNLNAVRDKSHRRDTTYNEVSRRGDTSFLTFIKHIFEQLFKWANTWSYLYDTQKNNFHLKIRF